MATSSDPPGAMLLAGLVCHGHVHLVVGSGALAAARCGQSLAAGAQPVVVAPESAVLHGGLRARIAAGAVRWERRPLADADVLRLGRPDVGGVVDAVFVADAAAAADAERIARLCRRHRVPVNVVDAPHLCSLALLAVHADGPLQVGVTTNGRGCRLAARIRRDIAAALPLGLGAACQRLGDLRRRIQQQDAAGPGPDDPAAGDLDDSLGQTARFNRLVSADDDARARRMRWLGQVCEYWPLKRLAALTNDDVDRLLAAYPGRSSGDAPAAGDPAPPPPPGRLILAGSGPGHPALVTRATLGALRRADVVLADKLVPAGVLELVPRRTAVHIARKFPGNADGAQEELLKAALAGVAAGKTVVRLKQGDPFVYGRGGEEAAWFGARGLAHRVTVLPGLTSALSAPLLAGVPVTQRDVADQVLICTGTGKKGRPPPPPPEYVAGRTFVFLMALHRIGALVRELTARGGAGTEAEAAPAADPARALWPLATPCAVVERASCPDQRVIRTTLAHVADAVEAEGSRPPGLLIVGRACDALRAAAPSDAAARPWAVEDGFRGLDGECGPDPEWAPALRAGAPPVDES